MRKLTIAVALLFGFAGAAQAAGGDPEAGKQKAAACAACHGQKGNSPNNPVWPKHAGQNASYIAKQLRDFKSGARKNDTMSPMAVPLSDQDILDLAAYFSGLPTKIEAADPEKASKGERIYRAGIASKNVPACMGCHGPSGAGNPPAVFPSLSGQHPEYIAKTMKDFRAGTRNNDPKGMMRDVVARMSDAEIAAVAEYVSGLH